MATTAKVAAKRTAISMTVIFNLIVALLAGVEIHFALLKDLIGERYYPIAYFVVLMVNIALRFRTELKHIKQQLISEETT